MVQSPTVVREVDWAQKAWPLDLMYIDIDQIASQDELTFPKVLKYVIYISLQCRVIYIAVNMKKIMETEHLTLQLIWNQDVFLVDNELNDSVENKVPL